MPNVHNDTEDDVDYEMEDGRPDDPTKLFRGRICAGETIGVSIDLPPSVNHRFFSTQASVPPAPRKLAALNGVSSKQDVVFCYACVPAEA